MTQFILSVAGNLYRRLGLATLDLRDQSKRQILAAIAFFCCGSGWAFANPVLNVLTQTQRLEASLVQEFEQSRKVAVRVDFVSSPLDYETRIRSMPHNWDLIVADEQRLVALSLAKILRSLPETVTLAPNLAGLQRRARANEDGKSYVNLMADPMGLMFLTQTKGNPDPVAWNWVINPAANPLWRSRIALFADDRLNLMAAAVATGASVPVASDVEARLVQQWLTQAELQGRAVSFQDAVTSFLAEKRVAALAWQSDYMYAHRYINGLAFTVPKEGTYVERVGIGLVADTRNESLAVDFVKFIYDRRDQLAQRRGLLPLHTQDYQGRSVSNWRIYSDDIPRARDLAASLTKLRKERENRAARRR